MNTIWASENGDAALHRHLWQWASLKLFGHSRGFGPCACMGVFDGETLVAVMVYHNYDAKAGVIEVSGAADTAEWLKRHVLREMFAVPFDKMECQSIVMRVSPKDGRLRRILHAYGFKSFVLPRLRGREEDETVYILHDDVWRDSRFNKEMRNGRLAGWTERRAA